MMFTALPFIIVPSLALIGMSYLWCKKVHAPARRQDSRKTGTSLISFSQAQPSLELGMEHARRLEYKLAIVVIQELDQAAPGMAAANDEPDTRRVVDVLRNTSLLRETLRMTDIAAYDEDRQFVVIMLPGVDIEHAAHTAERIRNQLHLEPGNGVLIGYAEFPGNGLLLEDLIAGASSRSGQSEAVTQIHARMN